MKEIVREKKKGFSLLYLVKAAIMRKLIGDKYQTPGFGLAGQLFASVAREVVRTLGPVEGEELLKRAVSSFGAERGKRIAGRVSALGKPLSLRNWIIYTDISPSNFPAKVEFPGGCLEAQVEKCAFMAAADQWGLREYASAYCRHADHAILEGYNPEVELTLKSRHDTGKNFCVFRYRMKE